VLFTTCLAPHVDGIVFFSYLSCKTVNEDDHEWMRRSTDDELLFFARVEYRCKSRVTYLFCLHFFCLWFVVLLLQ
jgi:hypothetical protein